MKEKLEQYLDELVIMLKDGGAFALEQLPLFVQEYLAYYVWYHGLLAIIWMIPTVLILCLPIWCYRNIDDEPVLFVVSAFSVLPCIGVVHQGLQLIQVLIAPRVYLIENLTNLL